MKYRNFGDSDLVTSVIGFGGWPMGRDHYGSFDEEEVIRAVHLAIDLGSLYSTRRRCTGRERERSCWAGRWQEGGTRSSW